MRAGAHHADHHMPNYQLPRVADVQSEAEGAILSLMVITPDNVHTYIRSHVDDIATSVHIYKLILGSQRLIGPVCFRGDAGRR